MLIEITAPDGQAEAILARPSTGEGPFPGILFYMDAFGLRPRIEDMAQRIADWGYIVLAPNVFYREGTVAQLNSGIDMTSEAGRKAAGQLAFPRIGRLTTGLALRDINGWLTALSALDGVSSGPMGTTGYCMGARLAVRMASAHPESIAACGGFHGGGLATDDPDSPHLGLAHAKARFVFGHADHDRSMDREAVARLGEALAAAGLPASNEIYLGAAHGYTMADSAAYNEAATERHFSELREVFDATLKR
jgi:carboxymethylenebutenolidase